MRKALPPVTAALAQLIPDFLTTYVMIQHELLANSYTVLYHFCSEHGFGSAPTPIGNILADFEASFTPVRKEMEGSFKILQQGKTVHQPMSATAKERTPSFSSEAGSMRRASGQSATTKPMISPPAYQRNGSHSLAPPAPNLSSKPRIGSPSPPYPVDAGPPADTRGRIPSINKIPSPAPSPGPPEHAAAGYSRKPSWSTSTDRVSLSSAAPTTPGQQASGWYSKTPRQPSPMEENPWANAPSQRQQSFGRVPSNGSGSITPGGIALPGIAKKKPPPPPPKKKLGEYVTALYDFEGEAADELSFREGDKIRVVEKTESVEDWWLGELRGMRGSFPANYVQRG